MKNPTITLNLIICPTGYEVELREHLTLAPDVWEWSGCQDFSGTHDPRQTAALLCIDLKNCIRDFEKRHIAKTH